MALLLLLLLLLVGIILDLAFFYQNNNNSLLGFTISGFVIYTLIVFTSGVQNATRKAYTDVRTGLVNRARWNELMHSDTAMAEPYGFVMIDLNGLKRVNDTLGHEPQPSQAGVAGLWGRCSGFSGHLYSDARKQHPVRHSHLHR